ncbi:MaoC/PaaZ C-terminal domain-containing protein [Natronorubrum sp. FCH18a]|uniref:MaoC/PaaZ C-terminal domain-containing protein n=1 Tax=Natronorubrum sp. FCH18a TaxID=3447018 RepID=UPI003F51A366
MTRYYEDLECGVVHETGTYTIRKDEIISFAEQFDPQPFHIDEEAAEESMFGGLVASGLHTLCLTVRFFTTEFVRGDDDIALIGGGGMDKLRFHEPVRPRDTLQFRVKISKKSPSESRSDRGHVYFRHSATRDDTEVLSFISHSIANRTPTEEE